MAVNVNINQLTADAHGMSTLFPTQEVSLADVGLNATGRDVLGRPYFMDVELTSALLGETWRLPFEPLVRIGKQKKLVETVIAGNGDEEGGIVIEQINKSNYDIQIRGILMESGSFAYPASQVEKLQRFCESSEALDIDCDLLELFKIRKLVIKSFAIDEMHGQPYSQRYVINAISYTDFYGQLKLNNL